MHQSPSSIAGATRRGGSGHPLDAPLEQKLFHADLGRMVLTPRVKVALFAVQGYLGVMVLLVGWKLIAGI